MGSYEYSRLSKDDKDFAQKRQYREISLLSQITLSWMNPVFRLGNQRYLNEGDLLELEQQDDTKLLTEKLLSVWTEEKTDREKAGKKPRLWLGLLQVVPISKILVMTFDMSFSCICLIAMAVILNTFLQLLEHRTGENLKYIWACAAALPLLSLLNGFAQDNFLFTGERVGMQMMAAIRGIIYHKILTTGKEFIRTVQTGHVINLLSTDTWQIQAWYTFIFRLIFAPFYLISTTVYLSFVVGWATATGIMLCLLVIPSMLMMFACAFKLREKVAVSGDKRIGLVTESVTGIRSVKAHALEEKYESKIGAARSKEMKYILYRNILSGAIMTSLYTFRQAFTFGVLLTLFLMHKHVTPGTAFLVVATSSTLSQHYVVIIQWSAILIGSALKSLERIQEFIMSPSLPSLEIDSCSVGERNEDGTKPDLDRPNYAMKEDSAPPGGISMKQLTCKAANGNSDTLIKDITLDVGCGELVTVTGPVGSGKSSLLLAIANEIPISSGNIKCDGKVAYISQSPWVFTGTVKENILFNLPYKDAWYKQVVSACQLQQDLKEFPDVDETVVGERGVTLSGGQQSRLTLARAIYADADIYLMDNPLSAVDAKVGKLIFDNCIIGLLGKKTRVLVTYDIEAMKKSDSIVLMEGGNICDRFPWSDERLSQLLQENKTLLSSREGTGDQLLGKDNSDTNAEGLAIKEENKKSGRVTWRTYWEYLRDGSSTVAIIAVILLAIIAQAAYVSPDLWLAKMTGMNAKHQQANANVYIWVGLNFTSVIFLCARVLGLYLLAYRSSISLHRNALTSVLHSPVLFFDTTPAGRILNRFSKDFNNMDVELPTVFVVSFLIFLAMCSSVLVASFSNYWVFLGSVPLLAVFFWLFNYFLKCSREVKRLDAICGSPVFSHAMETMNGLEPIRAHHMQGVFLERFYDLQNRQNQAFFLWFSGYTWLGLRIQLIFSLLIATVTVATVLMDQGAGWAGLALGTCLPLSVEVITMAKFSAYTESYMTSTERVMEYTKLEQEPGYSITAKPPDNWPTSGHIAFNDVTLRYYEGGPSILNGFSCDLEGRGKIGIAGRTGAGKSSIVAALMRMPEAEGTIIIDGVDISTIRLQETRKSISVFSQTPVLFSGTVRENLDPFEQYTDTDLWKALEKVQLNNLVENLDGKLDFQLMEEASNLSMGEKQLLCLARTLLKRNKILVLDEPTAHVDPLTESLIQQALLEVLQDCVVITIAHRLNTLADCDLIIVLERGQIIGMGTTEEMLSGEQRYLLRDMEDSVNT